MEVTVFVRPAVSPLDRGEIEDRLVAALGEGEVVGGGTMLDGSECDLTIELADDRDPAEVLRVARAVLGGISFSLPTEVVVQIDGVEHALHEN